MKINDKSHAVNLMVDYLRKAAIAHRDGNYEKIEDGYDDMDSGLPRDRGDDWHDIFIALVFWDEWIDARNHEWQYYEPIRSIEWPNLAEVIANDLESGRQITEEIIIDKFDLSKQRENSLLSKIKRKIIK